MKRFIHILALSVLLLANGCVRDPFNRFNPVPEGTPVTVSLGFGAPEIPVLEVGTRAEATPVDEAHVHDLYVFIFRPSDSDPTKYIKLYGRYFSYEHQVSKDSLNASANECWFVENQTISGVTPSYSKTRGAVKIATSSYENCIIVLLANVSNTLTMLDDEEPVVRLNEIDSLSQLKRVKVTLTQDVVTRKDYFFMMAITDGVNTGTMHWNVLNTQNYNTDPKCNLPLSRMDAKVRFRIKANATNISKVTPRFWQVCKAPAGCYLFDVDDGGPDTNLNPTAFDYFDTEETYFDGTETDPDTDEVYQVFSFYTLENRLNPRTPATTYAQREKQEKEADPDYPGCEKNGEWVFANKYSTYVRFDVILTLELAAIEEIDPTAHEAMTTDVAFVVHLGDFSNSGVNDYNTRRGTCYTYNVTINNSTSIHTEVMTNNEVDPAQEGFLLLVKEGVVNCDAHYEYRSITFNYNDKLDPSKLSWYVKTPFNEGGALNSVISVEDGIYYYPAPDSILDYKWVLFEIDSLNAATGKYLEDRRAFPGETAYHPAWKLVPGAALADSIATCPKLLDISQLVSYIFFNQKRKQDGLSHVFDADDKIIVTAFVNEYYYEKNPETEDIDPQLWRKFVNAKPREMHILSDAETSLDRKSDVITSSQSIIQQSIQTIYNIYDTELESIWGTEHKDEMREMAGEYGWGFGMPDSLSNDKENGRLNSSIMWNASIATPDWADYVDYLVPNNNPELLEEKQALAYSCMTRNRDNNGNGKIDPDEIRWYMAAESQLMGMFIGGEALSTTARLYQPFPGEWRAHVVSSSASWQKKDGVKIAANPRVVTSEEGVATYDGVNNWMNYTDGGGVTIDDQKNRIRSVRCLRNVGTYVSGGVRRDISYAPLTTKADRYYTFTSTGTGADIFYTFQFNRLDPKALRPFTTQELPFHNEHSAHNRVYLRMETQKPSQHIHIDKDTVLSKINPEISAAGVNPYCPAGYRLPNQVELALMASTFSSNKTMMPQNHPDSLAYPEYAKKECRIVGRTYYSRGHFGKPADQKPSERKKASWVWGANKLNCSDTSGNYLVTRCVKDISMTGTIMGDMFVPQDSICPGEKIKLDFKYSSSAASLNYASLKLRYTTPSGVNKEKEILLDKEASGIQYVYSQEITVPSLSDLDLVSMPDTGVLMKLRFEVRNTYGQSMVTEKPIRLIAFHMVTSVKILPGWVDGKGFPVKIDAVSFTRRYPVSSVQVKYKINSGEWISNEMIGVTHPVTFRDTAYVYPDITPAAPPVTEGDSVTVQVVLGCADGVSQTWLGSIKILRAGFTAAGDTATTFIDTASGIYFERGDFLEANIDLSGTTDTQKQGLLSIGLDSTAMRFYRTNDVKPTKRNITGIHVHYRSPSALQSLRITYNCDTNFKTTNSSSGTAYTQDRIIFRFDQNGMYFGPAEVTLWPWNNEAWYSTFISHMCTPSPKTLLIGQTQGLAHSTATYDYIRVVHQAVNVTPAP